MKKQVITLLVGAAICATTPVFAMEQEEDYDQRLARLQNACGTKIIKEYEDGSYIVKTTTLERSLDPTKDENDKDYFRLRSEIKTLWRNTPKKLSDEAFEALATTGQYQQDGFLLTADKDQATRTLAFYRENQNDQGELAKNYYEELVENYPYLKNYPPRPFACYYYHIAVPNEDDTVEYSYGRLYDYSPIHTSRVKVKRELISQ